MTPDEVASAIAKGIAAGNTITNNLLFGLVAIALIILVVVVFNTVRTNAVLIQFIMSMSGRSVSAVEQSSNIGQANFAAIAGQGKTLDKHTGSLGDIATATEEIGDDVKLMLTLSRGAGDKLVTLARYAIEPSPQGKLDVKEIADDKEKGKNR